MTSMPMNTEVELPSCGGILKRRAAIILIGAFVLVNALILFVVDPSSRVANGADTESWLGPAKALVGHGVFGTTEEPLTPGAGRGPIYPAVLAGLIAVSGEKYPSFLAILQAVCLLFASLLTAKIAEFYRSGTASLALGLMLFNPNLLGAAQLVQAETVYLLIIVLLMVAILRWGQTHTLYVRRACLVGVLAGLAALTRPEGVFLIACMPILMVAAALLQPPLSATSLKSGRLAASAAACVLASLLVVAPWVARNIAVGIGARINDVGNTAYYVWGAVEQVTRISDGLPIWEASRRVQAERQRLQSELPDHSATVHEIAQQDLKRGITALTGLPIKAHLVTILQAKLEYLFAGGAGNWIGLLFGEGRTPIAAIPKDSARSYLSGWLDVATRYGGPEFLIIAISLGYVLVIRMLDLIGVWRGWRKPDRQLLFILLAGIAFFAFAQPYYGPSRFRLPAEPAFVLLAILALRPRTSAAISKARSAKTYAAPTRSRS